MRMSMSNIAWLPRERAAAYEAMAGAGMTGLEIAPGLFFHASEDPFSPSATVAAEALAEIGDRGLSLVSMQSLLFGTEGAALFEGAAPRERLRGGVIRAIDLAGRFGISNLVFGSPGQRRIPEDMATDMAWEIAADLFRDLGDYALAAGTAIAIEANPAAYGTNFLTTLEESLAFVAFVDHPAIVPILDLGAMHMDDGFDKIPGVLADLAPRLNHIHVSEPQLAPAPAPDTDLTALFAALDTAGYDRAVSIEMKRAPEGLAAVRSAIARFAAARNGVML